jgi:hypothetical protein
MRKLLTLLCFFVLAIANAQPPAMELTPNGFDIIEVQIPSTSNDKLIQLSTAWAADLNRKRNGYDATDVTSNSMVISAYKKNAFFIRNNGDSFNYAIQYTMKLSFHDTYYTMHFLVNDIYTNDDVLVKYKLPDYFTPDGDLKEGYEDLKPSLEKSVNDLALSYYNFIVNFR